MICESIEMIRKDPKIFVARSKKGGWQFIRNPTFGDIPKSGNLLGAALFLRGVNEEIVRSHGDNSACERYIESVLGVGKAVWGMMLCGYEGDSILAHPTLPGELMGMSREDQRNIRLGRGVAVAAGVQQKGFNRWLI